MAKITVELEAFYGYSCGFQSHGSNETVELEVSDSELDALKKFGKEQITAEDIVAAIESGDTTLQSLHEKLEEKFYYMVEEYWLYEADNECLDECLAEHIEQDMSEGIYPPVTYDELIEWYETGDIDSDKLDFLAGFDEGGYLYEEKGTIKFVNNKVSLVFEGDDEVFEGGTKEDEITKIVSDTMGNTPAQPEVTLTVTPSPGTIVQF